MYGDLDIDLLEKYFLEVFPDRLVNEEAYHMLLLVLGERPGVLLMNVKRSDIKMIRDFCNEFDLNLRLLEMISPYWISCWEEFLQLITR